MTFYRFAAAVSAATLFVACGSAGDEAQAADASQAPASADPASAEAAATGPDLAPVLDFADAHNCRWSGAAERIFEAETTMDDDDVTHPGTVAIPGVADPVTARIDHPYPDSPEVILVHLDFEGRWLGLPVIGMTDAFIEEGDGLYGRGIRFDAPVERVAAALAEAGFDVAPDGSEREREIANHGGDRELMVSSVKAEDGETVFLCNQVYVFEGQEF